MFPIFESCYHNIKDKTFLLKKKRKGDKMKNLEIIFQDFVT